MIVVKNTTNFTENKVKQKSTFDLKQIKRAVFMTLRAITPNKKQRNLLIDRTL
jgi:hypothetical protein